LVQIVLRRVQEVAHDKQYHGWFDRSTPVRSAARP
jgi:hypothetical protein